MAERIAAALARDPAYARLAQAALTWLDGRARAVGGQDFASLPAARREALVAEAAGSPTGSAPRTFFQATWDDAVFHAYADRRAWSGLGYAGPLQPVGFPDHARAPERS